MSCIIKPLNDFHKYNWMLYKENEKLYNCILSGGVLISGNYIHLREDGVLLIDVVDKESRGDYWIPIPYGTYKITLTDLNLPNGKWYTSLTLKEAPVVKAYEKENESTTKHSHYFKDCPYAKVDVYRILEIFDVTDPCIQHCVKKLLCAGGRGHKDINLDIQNCIDTLLRYQQMREEEKNLEN